MLKLTQHRLKLSILGVMSPCVGWISLNIFYATCDVASKTSKQQMRHEYRDTAIYSMHLFVSCVEASWMNWISLRILYMKWLYVRWDVTYPRYPCSKWGMNVKRHVFIVFITLHLALISHFLQWYLVWVETHSVY